MNIPNTNAEMLRQVLSGWVGKHTADEQTATLQGQPVPVDDGRIELVLYRDPDGRGADGLAVALFIGGEQVTDGDVYVIDPGAGYSSTEWDQARDHEMARASHEAAQVIASFYADGAETEFIEGDLPGKACAGGYQCAASDHIEGCLSGDAGSSELDQEVSRDE